jgi:hypothetical protein
MSLLDIILKWIGIITVMYFLSKILNFLLKKVGVNPNMTWKEIFRGK